ncbi:MAG: hypothetical protein EA393_03460 [Bacteroidetes bacterium]|nr:MAG: hypothetical protein EA393_03460 [Bacteroidota bacterium]
MAFGNSFMRILKSGFVLYSLLLLSLPLFSVNDGSQSDDRGVIRLNLNINHGRMTPHYTLQAALNEDRITGLDISSIFLNKNEISLQNTVLGIGYFFSNLGNNEVYGYVHSAYLGMWFPLLTRGIPVQLKLGFGPGYVTQRHHPINNPLNRALGSHLNAYGQITLTGNVPLIRDKWLLRTGISFNHVSNGLIVAPNQGINTLAFHAGFDLDTGISHSGAMLVGRRQYSPGRQSFNISIASGIKQVDEYTGKQIIASSLILDYGYMLLPALNTGLGVGFYYNDTWAYPRFNSSLDEDNPPFPFQSALHLVLELEKKPLAVVLNPGFYIYRPTDEIPWFTGRLGFRYYFRNNISLMFGIKHHWFALADYFEWGVGYRFLR